MCLLFYNNYNAIMLTSIVFNIEPQSDPLNNWFTAYIFSKKNPFQAVACDVRTLCKCISCRDAKTVRQSRKQSGNFLQHRDGLVRITRQTWPVRKVFRFLWVFIARRVGSPSIALLDRASTKSTRETTTTPRSKVPLRNLREELRDSQSR